MRGKGAHSATAGAKFDALGMPDSARVSPPTWVDSRPMSLAMSAAGHESGRSRVSKHLGINGDCSTVGDKKGPIVVALSVLGPPTSRSRVGLVSPT